MNAILNILKSLGLNETVYPQFAIFIVTYLFLNHLVFKPYMAAYAERRKRTVGSQDVAKEMQSDIDVREAQYAHEAKEINAKIKSIFDAKKSQANKETSVIVSQAQSQAQEELNKGKTELQTSFSQAQEQMKNFIPELGQTIKQRLLDR